MLTLDVLRKHILEYQTLWGTRPVAVLACVGFSDEHWQIWHPDDLLRLTGAEPFPYLVITPDGHVGKHPDTTR